METSPWQRFIHSWRRFAQRKIHNYPRDIPPGSVIKGTGIIMLGPAMLFAALLFYQLIELEVAFWGLVFLFCISLIFVRPYIANLSALTNYVRALSVDQYAEAPDLSFLNNVEQLQEAIQQLHKSWERRGKQLEQTVRENRILINSLPDIIILLDEQYGVINTNSMAYEVFGSQHLEHHVQAILHHPEIRETARLVQESGEGQSTPYTLSEPFTRHYVVRIERFPPYSPSKISLIVVMHDITEQKNIEMLLADFVANASHEIRTPLASVIGFIETLQTTAKDDTEARAQFLEIMRVQAERIAKLVNDLLSLSRIERTIGTRPHELVHLGNLLKEVEQQAQLDGRDKKMKISLDIRAKRLPKVIGDTEQLRRVFENLVSNAIKYSPSKGSVRIVASTQANERQEAGLKLAEQLIAIAVEDEGEGIAPEHIPRLTERFYRVDTARSRKVGGSGLGLAIVRQILERHHGVLDIESEVGKGSTFTVLLPAPTKEQVDSVRRTT